MVRRLLVTAAAMVPLFSFWSCGSSSVSSVTRPSTAALCQPEVSTSTASFGAAGGNGTAQVDVSRECAWTASTAASWIAITSAASGQGDGSLSYRVAQNPEPIARRGTLTISGVPLELSQEAAPCSFVVTPNAGTVAAGGGNIAIEVKTAAVCAWTASSDAPWATPSPSSGKGGLTVQIAVAANAGPERSAKLIVAGTQVGVSQSGPPSQPAPPAPTPSPAPTPPPPPSPTPTPSPPVPTPAPPTPGPPPASKPISLSGTIESSSGTCPDVVYVIAHRTVRTSAGTDFQKGSCSSTKPGKDVQVEGVELADGTIRADVVIRQ
jgi:hypothetical protein